MFTVVGRLHICCVADDYCALCSLNFCMIVMLVVFAGFLRYMTVDMCADNNDCLRSVATFSVVAAISR